MVDGSQNQYGCGKRTLCPHKESVKHDANHLTNSSVKHYVTNLSVNAQS